MASQTELASSFILPQEDECRPDDCAQIRDTTEAIGDTTSEILGELSSLDAVRRVLLLAKS